MVKIIIFMVFIMIINILDIIKNFTYIIYINENKLIKYKFKFK